MTVKCGEALIPRDGALTPRDDVAAVRVSQLNWMYDAMGEISCRRSFSSVRFFY